MTTDHGPSALNASERAFAAGGGTTHPLRTIFMGTPEIAVPALRALAARSRVLRVVTQPDRPAGRGNQLQAPAVKSAALELGLPVWQPATLKGAEAAPELQGADLFVVMAYGELLRQPVLDLPPGGCINLHGSLLPRWRGASPLQAAIRAGDAESGVTVMRMVRALDAGPMYAMERIALGERPTLPWLHDAMAELAAGALDRFLAAWPPAAPVAQDDAAASVCRKLIAEDGRLDFTATMAELDRWIRAYTPAPGCWAAPDADPSVRLRILEALPHPGVTVASGEVLALDGKLLVGCGDGSLAITRLQSPGKRAQSAGEWLNGNRPPRRLG